MAQGLGPGVAVRAVDLARERWALLPDRVDQGAMVLDRADRLGARAQPAPPPPAREGAEWDWGRIRLVGSAKRWLPHRSTRRVWNSSSASAQACRSLRWSASSM